MFFLMNQFSVLNWYSKKAILEFSGLNWFVFLGFIFPSRSQDLFVFLGQVTHQDQVPGAL